MPAKAGIQFFCSPKEELDSRLRGNDDQQKGSTLMDAQATVRSEDPVAYSPQALLPGWYTLDKKTPHLIGSRCTKCGTYYFPKVSGFCRNPACDSDQFEETQLSRTGKLWSYTSANYQPPEPYVSAQPFKPFAIAAVRLVKEKMIVLGAVVDGVGVDALKMGAEMELVLEPLADGKLTWKWKPLGSEPGFGTKPGSDPGFRSKAGTTHG